MKQTAPEYIKSQGLPSLVYVAKAVNKDPRTIYKWYESNPDLFEAVVAGVRAKGFCFEGRNRTVIKNCKVI